MDLDIKKEKFKDIPNYEGLYQISNLGRVKFMKRRILHSSGNSFVVLKEKILKGSIGNHGYNRVNLTKLKKGKRFMVHVLMAIAFLDYTKKTNKQLTIDHKDNIKTNNDISNLQLITFRENLSKDKKNKTSKYTGVSWNKKRNIWVSQIMINKKIRFLGYYKEETKASEAYQKELLKAA